MGSSRRHREGRETWNGGCEKEREKREEERGVASSGREARVGAGKGRAEGVGRGRRGEWRRVEKDLRANFPRSLNLILIPPQFNSPHPTTTTRLEGRGGEGGGVCGGAGQGRRWVVYRRIHSTRERTA